MSAKFGSSGPVDPEDVSEVQAARLAYNPALPPVLRFTSAKLDPRPIRSSPPSSDAQGIAKLFPRTFGQPRIELVTGAAPGSSRLLKIGVVLSGGQAAGGHNVISGLHDFLVGRNPQSELYGFLGGPIGIINGNYIKLTDEYIARYRNQGGFDIIGTGRDKIETDKQLASSLQVCQKLDLDGLVVIGGDDSNTNAAILAEYFKANNLKTNVIGVPKTIDGDLKSPLGVEVSFGFDSATKVYAEAIGNIATDANSARKYYHFIRLMGRSASHITLECALQTHPNITLIGEEVAAKNQTLQQITDEICHVVIQRSQAGKNFGIVLLPEGLIEFIPEVGVLISELNELLAKEGAQESVAEKLTPASRKVFEALPTDIRHELLIDRDPHGNVQVSKIETEKLFIHLVSTELKKRKKQGTFTGSFSALGHFMGYEGRCVMPSNFDCDYCYALGRTAAALLENGLTGYMAVVTGLTNPTDQWQIGGLPLTALMNVERRKGKDKPVIKKALVELDGKPFKELCKHREKWARGEHFRNPGPIQYVGPASRSANATLLVEYGPATAKKAAL